MYIHMQYTLVGEITYYGHFDNKWSLHFMSIFVIYVIQYLYSKITIYLYYTIKILFNLSFNR